MTLLFSITLTLALPAFQSAPSPTLTLDLNPQPTGLPVASSSPRSGPGSAGGRVYFLAGEFAETTKTWVSDGTIEGTGTVAAPGSFLFGADEPGAALPDGRLVFTRRTASTGAEPGVSDLSQPGSQLLRDVVVGTDGSFPRQFTAWRDAVWFLDVTVGTSIHGPRTLFRTDGTPAGTTTEQERGLAFNVPNVNLSGTSLAVAGDRLFLYQETFSTTAQLWVKNAPDQPFALVREFSSGGERGLHAVGDRVVFTAADPVSGVEPWSSDGTSAGTQPLIDLEPGTGSGAVQFLSAQGGWLWFDSQFSGPGVGLWVTDGTPGGTFRSAGVAPEANFGFEDDFVGFQGSLLFVRNEAPRGLFRADPPSGTPGTPGFQDPSSTQIFSAVGSNRSFGLSTHAGNAYFFSGLQGGSQTLFRTAGQPGDAQPLAVLDPAALGASAIPAPLGSTANGLLFRGFGPDGIELWSTDGTPGGTGLLVDIARAPETGPSTPRSLTRLRDGLWFGARPASGLPEVYFSDGTGAGTVSLSTVLLQAFSGTDYPQPLGEVSDRLLFAATQPGIGKELWATDGTLGGTQLVADVRPGPEGGVASVPAVVVDNQLIFNGFNAVGTPFPGALWRSDGTSAGTINLLPDGVDTGNKALLGSRAYFGRNSAPAGFELWSTDGTLAGTQLVADLRPGPINSAPRDLIAVGEQLFFGALNDGGWELGVSDGTAGGTRYLGPTAAGRIAADPRSLVAVGDRLVFTALTADGKSRDLWASDGSAAGTNVIATLASALPFNFADGGIEGLTSAGDRAFFFGSSEVPGFPYPVTEARRSLWVTDGTAAGTGVVDIGPGAALSYFPQLGLSPADDAAFFPVGSGGEVVFIANDEVHGFEPWISDGTEAGTRLLADVRPGSAASDTYQMEDVGRLLMVAADDGVTGAELHTLSLDFATGYLLEPYGTGCGASLAAAGAAQLGETAVLDLSSGAPYQLAYLFFSAAPAWIQFGGGCTQYLAQPLLRNVLPTDATGFLSIDLPVPNVPALVGLELYFQHLVTSPGGPLLGAFELSNGVEAILGA